MKDINFPIGVFLHSLAAGTIEDSIQIAADLNLNTMQIGPLPAEYFHQDQAGADSARSLRQALEGVKQKTKVSSICVAYEGAPGTIGIEDYSSIDSIANTGGYGYQLPDDRVLRWRIDLTKKHIDFGASLREADMLHGDKLIVTTHIGFIDRDPQRGQIVRALTEVLEYCDKAGAYLGIETGSEHIVGLIGFIKEMEQITGIHRLGLNFDPANFFLYGTQDPIEALSYISATKNGHYVYGVHAKDAAHFPRTELNPLAEGNWKGAEVPLGLGSVQWLPTIIALDNMGYKGSLTIEREGQLINPENGEPEMDRLYVAEQRMGDIAHARDVLLNVQRYARRM